MKSYYKSLVGDGATNIFTCYICRWYGPVSWNLGYMVVIHSLVRHSRQSRLREIVHSSLKGASISTRTSALKLIHFCPAPSDLGAAQSPTILGEWVSLHGVAGIAIMKSHAYNGWHEFRWNLGDVI